MMSRLSRGGNLISKMMVCLAMIAMMFCMVQAPAVAADGAATPEFTLSFETPVGFQPDRPQDNSTFAIGAINLPLDFDGKFCIFGNARYGFGDRGSDRAIVCSEDIWKGGLSYALNDTVKIYGYYEERFSLDTRPNRVMCGVTFTFRE